MEKRNIFLGIVLIIIATLLVLLFVSFKVTPNKYKIKQGSNTYYTNYFTKDANGCINFQSGCGCGNKKQNITICGDYIVIDNFGK